MLNFVYRVASFCRLMICFVPRSMAWLSLLVLVIACSVSPVAAVSEPAVEPSGSKPGQTNVVSLPAFVETGRGLAGLAFSGDGSTLYVTSNAENSLIVIDVATREIVQTISGPQIGSPGDGCSHNFCRGAGAVGVAISSDGHYAYVTSMKPDSLVFVDLKKGQIIDSVPVEWFPQDIVLSSDGKRAYLINVVSNSVSVVNLADRKTVDGPIQLWGGSATRMPYGRAAGLALSPDDKRLFVTNGVRGTVDVFATASGQQMDAVMPSSSPRQVATDPRTGNLVVLLKDGVVEYDAQTLVPIRARAFCRGVEPFEFALSPDGSDMALTLSRSNTAIVVNRDTNELTKVYDDTGDWPLGLGFNPDGSMLAVLATGDAGGVKLFSTRSAKEVDSSTGVFCNDGQFRAKNGVLAEPAL